MNGLTISLIAIGALIIVAVVLFNWWQERRFKQQVNHHFNAIQKDPLLDEQLPIAPASTQATQVNAHVEPYLDTQQLNVADEQVLDFEMTLPNQAEIDDVAIEETRFVALSELDDNIPVTPKPSIDALYSELINQEEHVAIVGSNQEVELLESLQSSSESLHHDSEATRSDTKAARDNIEEPNMGLPAMLHAQMDLIAVLYLADASTVEFVNHKLNSLFDDYDKPVFVHGLNADQQWVMLSHLLPDAVVSRFTCSLQLADRAGAVSRSVLNRFQLAVETLGLDINAHVEWQTTGDVLSIANALDTFCIEVDKTMGFHLVHGEQGAFTGTKLKGLAEAQGFSLAADGSFKLFDESAEQALPAFVMFNRDHHPFSLEMLRSSVVKAVTFQLDIPHVHHCTEAFNQMVQVAKQMAIGLNAVLVDDNNRPLGDIQIEKIRQQLKVIHATMLVRGIVPGSESALRLFS
ncbi:MAG: cell division protein FtsZ [Methylotenera sp.]|nr:cell division protein FtsZ [Methylotenera sp.]